MKKLKNTFLGFGLGLIAIFSVGYAGNQGLIGELFELSGGQTYITQKAFQDNSISGSVLIDNSITTTKLSGGITSDKIVSVDAGKINGVVLDSTIPASILSANSSSLSGRTLETTLTNDDMKIPTSKAILDKINPLLNCSATTINGYSIPLTNAMQLTSSISKTVTTANGSYVLSQQFKCNNGSFETYGAETKSSVVCSATTVDGYSVTALIGGNSVNITKTGAGTNGTITYQRTFSCSTDAILTYGSDTAISISCNADYYKVSNTTCAIVSIGQYAAVGANTASSCTNAPSNSAYTGRGGGSNSCLWNCNSNYLLLSGVCYVECGKGSVGSSCLVSGGTTFFKQVSSSLIAKLDDVAVVKPALPSDSLSKCSSGWRPPTYDELRLLYNNRLLINNFSLNHYISSTLNGYDGELRGILFSTGIDQYYMPQYRGKTFYVRCVRSI